MQIVYFGKKRPKIVALERNGIKREFKFEPFKATEVDEDFAGTLLLNAGDIFKRIDKDERLPDPKPVAKGEGYVGEVAADQLDKPLEEQVKKETKAEEGKDVDQAIADEIAARKAKKSKKA